MLPTGGAAPVPTATRQAMGVLPAWGGMPGALPWCRDVAAWQGWGVWAMPLLVRRWAAVSAHPARGIAEPRGNFFSVVRGALAGRTCSVAGRRVLRRCCEGRGWQLAGVPATLGVPEPSQGLL